MHACVINNKRRIVSWPLTVDWWCLQTIWSPAKSCSTRSVASWTARSRTSDCSRHSPRPLCAPATDAHAVIEQSSSRRFNIFAFHVHLTDNKVLTLIRYIIVISYKKILLKKNFVLRQKPNQICMTKFLQCNKRKASGNHETSMASE